MMKLKNSEALKDAQCGMCDKKTLECLYWAYDKNYGTTDERFMIVKCPNCNVVQTYPQPFVEKVEQYYPDQYFTNKSVEKYFVDNNVDKFQSDKVRKIKKYRASGRLLDIGCGVGYFVKAAMLSGYDVFGIEISSLATELGKKHGMLSITSGDFLSHPFEKDSFDIITLWHVFEHLPHPQKVLKKIYHVLRSQGLLVIAVPNFSSIQANFFREKWYHLEIPRHLFHYTPISLTRVVEEEGFSVNEINHFCREHNGSGILGSFMRISPPGESFVHKFVRKTIGVFSTNIVAWIESSISRGGTFELFAIKK